MRLANLAGRAAVLDRDGHAIDVEKASQGEFPSDPQLLFEDWESFTGWAETQRDERGIPFRQDELGPPVPRPRQVFAIGINYTEHAREAGYPPDSLPVTFTKFPACLTGPRSRVRLPTGTVDWEVEAVAAVSRTAWQVSRDEAWQHIAGLTVGQDLSERTAQLEGAKPQFSLAKSHPGFGPTGPWLVTPDELPDRDDLAISCALSGTVVQESRTSCMVYDIAELVVRLSSVCPLLPGDLIFTGTPAGVGNARTPKMFLTEADELVSTIEGIGTIVQTFTV